MQAHAGGVAEEAGGAGGGAPDPDPNPAAGPDLAQPQPLHAGGGGDAGGGAGTVDDFEWAWAATGPVAGSIALLAGVAAERLPLPFARPVRAAAGLMHRSHACCCCAAEAAERARWGSAAAPAWKRAGAAASPAPDLTDPQPCCQAMAPHT